MIELKLRIAPELLVVMQHMARLVIQQLRQHPNPMPRLPEMDEDMETFMLEDLSDALGNDLDCLEQLIFNEKLGYEAIRLDDAATDGVIRSCSAIRLKVRETALGEISDETLENGGLNLGEQPPEVQQSFMFYAFVGHLQSIVIAHVDPDAQPMFYPGEVEDDDDFDEEDDDLYEDYEVAYEEDFDLVEEEDDGMYGTDDPEKN